MDHLHAVEGEEAAQETLENLPNLAILYCTVKSGFYSNKGKKS